LSIKCRHAEHSRRDPHVYVVLVLFGFYLIYMYEPSSVHWLFSRLFNPPI